MIQREIKFIGKDIESGEWRYGTLSLTNKGELAFINNIEPKAEDVYAWTYEVDPKTVGQYTGLKDNNGVEIYEGDIDSNGMIVTYCGNQEGGLGMNAGWYLQKGDFEHWIELESRHNDNGDNHIIVGNIHQNPELL